MRFRLTAVLLLAAAGCSPVEPQRFSVYFQPYSADLDRQARETIDSAARFAQAHPRLPITLTGYSAPPDPKLDVEGLSASRMAIVKQVLVGDGVEASRVSAAAKGITDPKSLPAVAVRRVDIGIGY
jgi:outer membrane protein OmpA-like peptidoglycan-associated protein